MRKVDAQNSRLCIKDQYGQLINQPMLFVASTGWGKGIAGKMVAEDYHANGCIVLVIADPKQELEFAFSMFKPEARYHLDNLKAINKQPKAYKVKLYHPFTFNIPTKEYLPDYNFYTIPLKELGKREWGLIAETHAENESVSLLLKSSDEINNEDGLIAFAHYIQDSIKGKIKGKKKLADWRNFGLEASSGTMKDLSRITNYIRPFKNHYFLSKKNSIHNLNWKEILNDQEPYHVFVTNFLDPSKDEKTIGFLILYLIESILRNKKYLKRPLVIVCPEIKNLCPFKPQGYKEFLADSFTKALSMIRSSGRGMSFIGDTQNWGGLDKGIKDVIKITLLGQLSGNDIDEIGKKWIMTKEKKEFLRKPPKLNSFTIAEDDYFSSYVFFMPSSMHKEPSYNFHEMYLKKYKEYGYPIKKYFELIKEMKKNYKEEEDKFKKKVLKRQKEEDFEELKKIEEKEFKSGEKDLIEKKEEKIKEAEDKSKEILQKLCYEMYNNQNLDKKDKSLRKIAEKFEIKSHKTIKKYIDEYEEKLRMGTKIDDRANNNLSPSS